MQLILMRHGPAVERDEWSGDDFHRPLTERGHRKTRAAARGLASVCAAPELIASSPKTRAMQTMGILHEAWKKTPSLQLWPELMRPDLDEWLRELRISPASSLCLVGHEPDLSRFAALVLSGQEGVLAINFKKAGALWLEFDPQTGRATLEAMLLPRVLRALNAQK